MNTHDEPTAPVDADPSDDTSLDRGQYVISYNDKLHDPNWVAWRLTKGDLGDVDRTNDFRPDDELPAGLLKVKPADYAHSGYNQGHMCPSSHGQQGDELDHLSDDEHAAAGGTRNSTRCLHNASTNPAGSGGTQGNGVVSWGNRDRNNFQHLKRKRHGIGCWLGAACTNSIPGASTTERAWLMRDRRIAKRRVALVLREPAPARVR